MTAAGRWACALALAAAGCGGRPEASDVAARIGEQTLRYERFERYLEANLDAAGTGASGVTGELDDAVASRLLDQLIDEQLLLALARAEGLEADPADDVRSAVEFLLRAQTGGDGADADADDAAEVEAYFRRHRQRFAHPARVRLWQIMVAERALAEEAERALAAGEPFQQVAARVAESPDANFCGDQGWLAHEDLPRAFAERVFALEPGEHTAILESNDGYYLFMVEALQPAAARGLEEAAAEIREALRGERADRTMALALDRARARYDVRVFPTNLPFRYQGRYAQPRDV